MSKTPKPPSVPATQQMTVEQFCDKHGACSDGRYWAIANCATMQEVWDTAKPEWLIWIATREGVLTGKELRKFAVWSARQVQHLMKNKRSINALDVAERHADGLATDEELAAVWDTASATASSAASAAASSAASATASSAASAAASAAASSAASATASSAASATASATASAAVWAAAWAAASSDASATVWDAAWATASAAQSKYLRENCRPNFNA